MRNAVTVDEAELLLQRELSSHIAFENITIILPTLNEASSIELLLLELERLYSGIQVVVVDDNSNDGTGIRVLAAQKKIALSRNSNLPSPIQLLIRETAIVRGITVSVLDALALVRTKYILVMDADLQHPPEIIKQLIEVFDEEADIVVASRRPCYVAQSMLRQMATYFATKLAKRALHGKGYSLTDPMSGMFIMRTAKFSEIVQAQQKRFELRGYKLLFDILACCEEKIEVREVFYNFGVRYGGESKLKPIHALYFFRSVFR
jgi:dolichol-phosphate mannosyltransferase